MPTISAIIPVYRAAPAAIRTVQRILGCNRGRFELEIVVVDDGSGDDTGTRIMAALGADVILVSHKDNLGRAAARNSGINASRGELLVFVDADCLPQDESFLQAHVALASSGACSAGEVVVLGNDFWPRYQRLGKARREMAGGVAMFSSANFMIAREKLVAVGGFDSAFRGYGFEDRDLALRLEASGTSVERNSAANVLHDDALDLITVCAKMEDAGSGNAVVFAQRHPAAYKALGYAAVDVRQAPLLRVVHAAFEPIRRWGIRVLSPHFESMHVPFALKVTLVKLLVALSFVHGSTLKTSALSGGASDPEMKS